MSISTQAPSYIRAISPYQPGKPITELAREMGLPVERIVKLASNENPLGMSPRARAAVAQAIGGIERYPDQFELIAALAERLGLGYDQIVLGNGSNDVLDLTARAFLAPGRSAVFSRHAFAVYPLATQTVGAECIEVPARQFGHDLDAMAAAIRPDTRVVWIANPNNPTGTFLPYPELRAFLGRVPGDVVVVLDEAYNEYLPPTQRVDAVAWLKEFPNLVVTRTFSKIYGLAGLRVGFAAASPEVADLLNRVRQPFNVNNLALAAAHAALDDHLFLAESYELNRVGLEQIVAGLKRLGLEHIPSHGNFVTFRAGDAAGINKRLLQQGIIVRPIAGYGMPEHLRVTIGLERENARFLEALEKVL
ncbi:histidinol-phosphate transaminase [Denitratisoma oestradiolicum]|uniref:Histidinol-phosphate aminotransferase n=1 Tax=Denitratisoma oestradiolicum TaxID=311182 RepID=A0A6S6XYG8_9PROT|nr:histidinol-phosphate transaminase [Denitratisoma oestradiolicum]TWO80186.1 histidinol-phosphate transaminase [Denitratisoma oestradiolicum]CAB1369963.1 Histidinol-phosphate aminotransferase 1 [Denitratisoma oestradiolicum]